MSKHFHQLLKDKRSEKKLTQGAIAKELEVTISFYSALEMGKRPPSPAALNQLVSFFGLNGQEEHEFHHAAARSIEQIRINSCNAQPNARSMALSLARSFDSLGDEKIKRLQDILND